MSYCPSVHVLTSIASVANALYIMKLLYNSTASMVTDAIHSYIHTVEHSCNKPEIPGQTVCYKQEFVISEQFPMRYCSTWLRSLLCYRGVSYKSGPLYICNGCILL